MSAINAKNNFKIYGLTGGIATGKSTVAKYLSMKGFLVFDADLVVSNLWQENTSLQQAVKQKYGIDLTKPNGKAKLAKLIFSNNEIKSAIEHLIHPLVLEEISKWIKKHNAKQILFLDIPLLYEIGYEQNVDSVILVYTNHNNQIERLMLRDNLNIKDAKLRLNSQIDIEEKRKRANYVIDNNNTIEDLYKNVDNLLKELV